MWQSFPMLHKYIKYRYLVKVSVSMVNKNIILIWKRLSIVGFDFFAKAAPFKVGAAYPNSWHLPRNSVDEIPHNVPAEREYALEMSRNGIIHWEILSDLKSEILDE